MHSGTSFVAEGPPQGDWCCALLGKVISINQGGGHHRGISVVRYPVLGHSQ